MDTLRVDEPDSGANYRNGPGRTLYSKGFLYAGDRLQMMCGKGDWYYSKFTYRSKSGLPSGLRGWVRSDMLYSLVALRIDC